MAGQRPTVTENICDGMQYRSFALRNETLTGHQHHALFTVEKNTAIERVAVRWGTADGSANLVKISYVANGTAMSGTTTDVTQTLDFNATANTNYSFSFKSQSNLAGEVPTNNIVPAGSLVFLHAASNLASLDNLTIDIRTLTKLH